MSSFNDLIIFDEIIASYEKIIEQIETRRLTDRNTKIFLSNGESFNYRISNNNIPHLLGLKIDYLKATRIFKSNFSFEILKELCARKDYIRELVKNGTLNINCIFSEYVKQKINYFFENIDININQILFICKYNREIAFNQGNNHQDCEYIIIRETDDNNLLSLQLKQNNNSLIPMSSKVFSSKNEANNYFKEVLTNQTLISLSSIILNSYIYDQGKKIYLNPREKRQHFYVTKAYATQYNCYIDITSDYEYYLQGSNIQKQRNIENHDIINSIIACITNGNIITEDTLGISVFDELPSDTKNLVYALNDNLVNSKDNNNGQIAYSKLKEEVKRLKDALEIVEAERKDIEARLTETQNKLLDSTSENEKLKCFQDDIQKVYEKYKTPLK